MNISKLKTVLLTVLMVISFVSFGKEYRYKKSGGKKNFWTGEVTYRTVSRVDTDELQSNSCLGSGNNDCTWSTQGNNGGPDFGTLISEIEAMVANGVSSGGGTVVVEGETFTYTFNGYIDEYDNLNYDLIIQSS